MCLLKLGNCFLLSACVLVKLAEEFMRGQPTNPLFLQEASR